MANFRRKPMVHPSVRRRRSTCRVRIFRYVRGKRVRLDASRCAHCLRKLHHAGPRALRAQGASAAIRCLDCRFAFCPRCARKHFAPVIRAQEKIMDAVVTAAVRTMRIKCGERRP